MQIAFLSQNARQGDAIGGQLAGQVRAALDAGHEARCFLSDGAALRPELRAYSAIGLPRGLWRSQDERAYLENSDVVVIGFGGDYPLLDLLPALVRRGKRMLFYYYGVTPPELWPEADQPRIQRAVERRDWIWFADAACAISTFAADELHQSTGYPRERIRVVQCFVDPLPVISADVRRERGFGGEPVVLFVGRIAANKDLQTLIRALHGIERYVPGVQLVCVGPKEDVYAEEAAKCEDLAETLRIKDRVHLLGAIATEKLAAWYRQADVLVLPSRHECFGLPPMEAAGAGLPVITSDAGALPETVGNAGLTFRTGDADDLARQLRRVLHSSSLPAAGKRIAIVAPRFGTDFAGGAEQSLRRMAVGFRERGYEVEAFTTCNKHDSRWANHYAHGTTEVDGLPVHRFPIDPFDTGQLAEACAEIKRSNGHVEPAVAEAYLRNSLGSAALLEALAERRKEFEAILTGPYLFKLTWQTAEQFKEKVLLVPCFHDEPYARLDVLKQTYRNVGGYLFHSEAEMEFAQQRLGQTHPRSSVIGTLLPTTASQGDATRGRQLAGQRYFVYCGRYCPEKGLDQLVRWSQHIAAQDAEFRLVLLGQGAMPLPKAPWLKDLGFVEDRAKYDVLAGALGLINLSPNESLSIVLLESWAQSVPVIGNADCAVIRRQIELATGGYAVRNLEDFTLAVRALSSDEALRQRFGTLGRKFVADRYQDPARYATGLTQAIADLRLPLPELMRREGRKRAALFAFERWQPKFLQQLEDVCRTPRRMVKQRVSIAAASESVECGIEANELLVPIRLRVISDYPITGEGLGRRSVWTRVFDAKGRPAAKPRSTPISRLLIPGRDQLLTALVRLPCREGRYRIAFRLGSPRKVPPLRPNATAIPLVVTKQNAGGNATVTTPFIAAARAALAEAYHRRKLPVDYVDVTEGRFARLKAWAKKKLLNNLRKAYLEPLVRQQSAVNEQLVTALSHLADAIAVQSNAAAVPKSQARLVKHLLQRVGELEAKLEEPSVLR